MTLSITNENKNSLTITPESKSGTADIWANHPETWAESGGTWDAPGFPLTLETKII